MVRVWRVVRLPGRQITLKEIDEGAAEVFEQGLDEQLVPPPDSRILRTPLLGRSEEGSGQEFETLGAR